jgi:hypothetical protein
MTDRHPPIAKIGQRIEISGHPARIERIFSDCVICRLHTGIEVSATFKQIEEIMEKQNAASS